MSDPVLATMIHIRKAIDAGESPGALRDLTIAGTLMRSVADHRDPDDHPLLSRADEYLAAAIEDGCDDVRFHARQARSLLWVMNGGGPSVE